MKRLWWIVAAAAAALILLLLLRKQEPPQLAFARVTRQSVVSTLPTNGKVEPVAWESVRAETPGLISSVPVQQGQSVSAGALIARISQPGVESGLKGAEARVSQSQSELETLRRGGKSAQIAELDASIAKAEFDRHEAQREYESVQRLLEKQAVARVEVQAAKQRLDADELSIRSLNERRKALVAPADVAAGRARLTEAEAQAQLERTKLDIGNVAAPISGVIYSLPARPGVYVIAGDLIANVGNVDQVRVKVYVDEPELGRVRVGLPVKITWDALPARSWDGSVERLPTEIVALGSRQVGEVWVTILNKDHDLVPGTTVNAEVRTDVARDALTIPKPALRHDRGPVGVYVLRGGRLDWQQVATGASDISNIAVTSGLKEGELVLLPTDTPVKEGDRVRAAIQ